MCPVPGKRLEKTCCWLLIVDLLVAGARVTGGFDDDLCLSVAK